MKLELNTNGAWRVVLSGLSIDCYEDAERFATAKVAAAQLAAISAATTRKPIRWRLVRADGRVVARCHDGGPWRDVEATE